MSKTRDSIIARLRDKPPLQIDSPPVYQPEYGWSKQEKRLRLTEHMTAVHTEVHHLSNGNWVEWLNTELPKRGLHQVLVGESEIGKLFKQKAESSLQIQSYDDTIDNWKDELFKSIDVGLTGSSGGIAESGSLILWPDKLEPRLMSLVPPVHIALLDSEKIFETFAQAMQQQDWADKMPTNALLISGPSKTADIEQTLAYGIHGPKQLIVLILG